MTHGKKTTNIRRVCISVEWICSPRLPYHGKHKGVVYYEFFKNLFNGLIGYEDVIHLNEFISLKSKCCSLNGFLVLRITSRCLNTLYDMLLFYLLNGIISYVICCGSILSPQHIYSQSPFSHQGKMDQTLSVYI